jgi:hypothetical protein
MISKCTGGEQTYSPAEICRPKAFAAIGDSNEVIRRTAKTFPARDEPPTGAQTGRN